MNLHDIEGINSNASFGTARIDEGYLVLGFNCDEEPWETYLVNMQNMTVKKLETGYYNHTSIDIEGSYVYYSKYPQYDAYGDGDSEYKKMQLSKFLK